MTIEELASTAKRSLCEQLLGLLDRAMDTDTADSSDYLDARGDLCDLLPKEPRTDNHLQEGIRNYIGLCDAIEQWGRR